MRPAAAASVCSGRAFVSRSWPIHSVIGFKHNERRLARSGLRSLWIVRPEARFTSANGQGAVIASVHVRWPLISVACTNIRRGAALCRLAPGPQVDPRLLAGLCRSPSSPRALLGPGSVDRPRTTSVPTIVAGILLTFLIYAAITAFRPAPRMYRKAIVAAVLLGRCRGRPWRDHHLRSRPISNRAKRGIPLPGARRLRRHREGLPNAASSGRPRPLGGQPARAWRKSITSKKPR